MSLNAGIEKIACGECGKQAERAICTAPAMFSDDYAIAKNYEKRKGAEPPIHGSASHPDTEPPSKKLHFS